MKGPKIEFDDSKFPAYYPFAANSQKLLKEGD